MKTFRNIYKFPLVELGYSIGRVYDSDNNFVFQFHIESKTTKEKLLKCINGEINLTNVSTEQTLLEKSKKITNSFTTMISELRSLNTELSNLEAQKEEEITKLTESKR